MPSCCGSARSTVHNTSCPNSDSYVDCSVVPSIGSTVAFNAFVNALLGHPSYVNAPGTINVLKLTDTVLTVNNRTVDLAPLTDIIDLTSVYESYLL
jgi:hypothetical protein